MATVKRGVMSGEEFVRHYSAAHKKKIYFHSQLSASATSTSTQSSTTVDLTIMPPQNGTATRRLLNAMAQRAGVSSGDDGNVTAPSGDKEHNCDIELDCIITDATTVSTGNSHAKDHVKVLAMEPEMVGNVVEDFSTFGFPEKENDKDYKGRTEEVALIIKKVTSVTKGRVVLPPFMTHSLREMLWQGREDAAVCLLVLFSQNNSEKFADHLFRVLNNGWHHKVLIWVADTQSNEGSKVQAKYGVGDQTTLLVVVPSQIPQCLEILNETNFDVQKLKDALANASEMLTNLAKERMKLPRAKETDKDHDLEDDEVSITNIHK